MTAISKLINTPRTEDIDPKTKPIEANSATKKAPIYITATDETIF